MKGLTQEPLVDENLNMVSPLHSLMRTFSFVLTLMYHLRSEIFLWTESTIRLGRSYRFLVKAKDEAKCIVQERTGIVMDAADPTGKGGSTNKGDVCQRLLTQHREVLVSYVPHTFQSDLRELLCRL